MTACRTDNPRGFTLIEVVVAVGAVVLLTLGIGQVFRQVSKLVGTGAAVAEVDQLARAVEAQLREDFTALSRMPAGETYFAIRARRLGDIDRDGQVDGAASGERPVYLTAEDAELELRAQVTNPYGVGGRGVTVRLDEIAFLAQGEYRSAQPGNPNDLARGALNARLYYGHGLRPTAVTDASASSSNPGGAAPFDPSLPPGRDPDSGVFNFPYRQWRPDGAPVTNPFDRAWGEYFAPQITGLNRPTRNQHAGRFVLLRHALLLSGGNAFETARNDARTVVPFIRDAENYLRGELFSNSGEIEDEQWGGPIANQVDRGRALPRAIRQGRTDIAAQSAEDVRRWFEGRQSDPSVEPPPSTARFPDATAFDLGPFDTIELSGANGVADQEIASQNSAERPLWRRSQRLSASSPARGDIRRDNLRGLQSAIAGAFARILADNEPPIIVRQQRAGDPDPAQAFMDVHAAIAERCSSFEIAWSDGTVWRGTNGQNNTPLEIDLDNNTANGFELQYKVGDLVWFDIDLPRRALTELFPFYAFTGVDPEILSSSIRVGPWQAPSNERSPGNSNARLNIPASQPQPLSQAVYDPVSTGGDDTEYLAIWGFRVPDDAGGYAGAWTKPRFIRVRMTLHDAAFRIAGGKRYEFVFAIDQQQ